MNSPSFARFVYFASSPFLECLSCPCTLLVESDRGKTWPKLMEKDSVPWNWHQWSKWCSVSERRKITKHFENLRLKNAKILRNISSSIHSRFSLLFIHFWSRESPSSIQMCFIWLFPTFIPFFFFSPCPSNHSRTGRAKRIAYYYCFSPFVSRCCCCDFRFVRFEGANAIK